MYLLPYLYCQGISYYAPDCREGAIGNKRYFCPSVCPSVCLFVVYIANNSRTQRPSVPKFGTKVPQLRCDSHTSCKVKRSKVRVTDGRGHTVSAEPGGHTVCFSLKLCTRRTDRQTDGRTKATLIASPLLSGVRPTWHAPDRLQT